MTMEGPDAVASGVARMRDALDADPGLARLGSGLSAVVMLDVGERCYRLEFAAGRLISCDEGPFVMPSCTFRLSAPLSAWLAHWQPVPPPGYHDLFALLRRGLLKPEGDLQPLMAHLMFFKRLLASPRGRDAVQPGTARPAPTAGPGEATIEPIVGRYLRLSIDGRPHRLYWEEAGQGIPLLCLHTAGSDGRQYRALLNDPQITAHFRVVVFDMPWHGKSSPPPGWQRSDYRLTSEGYVGQVVAVTQALRLDRPVVIGCSIGGRIVLHLAEQHPEAFRALIGLQSSPHVAPYYDVGWLHRPDVHGGEVCGAVAYGLTAPTSPESDRWETVWHYMQGGPGIFKGDLWFYKVDGDIRDRIDRIDTSRVPIWLLTGDYDFSCTADDTRELGARLGGAPTTIMDGMGHFPMSENPQAFLGYLRPVLDEIRRRGA